MAEKEYYYDKTIIDKKGNIWVDTRGSGLRLHGTSASLEKLYDDVYSTGNIYGQGFYTTDARDIAHGYTKKGKGDTPSLYDVKETKKVKLYDLEQPLSKEHKQYFNEMFGELIDGDEKTLREMYDNARGSAQYIGYSADEVQEIFYDAQDKLASEGYNGFQHTGGDKTNNKPHTVRIYWNPTKDISIKEIPQETNLVRGGGAGGKLLGLAGALGLASLAEDTYAQGKEAGLSDIASSGVTAGRLAYELFAPTISLLFESPKVGEGSDIVPEGSQFIDQYQSLEPDQDLFKGSL
jgi:hypothetical protein